MAKNCIICGNPTGSREHIFPAALGGRRTNKKIYCDVHNNMYSGLAVIISDQLSLFNALLGVVGDHASETKPVTMTDLSSGKRVELTNTLIRYTDPQIISQEAMENSIIKKMSFSSRKEAEDWVHEQRAKGFDVQMIGQGEKSKRHINTIHTKIALGGTEEGLRAIGYIAQTFLAHYFPAVARQPEIQGFKDYTLKNYGSDFVWWDFEPPNDLPKNNFPFGHRVIVGLNKDNSSAYARVSFFSTLNFAVHFGTLPVEASQSVITDIDPLAKSPPNDIYFWNEDAAKSPVFVPENLNSSLAEAINSGKAESCIGELIQRLVDYECQMAASYILSKIVDAGNLSQSDRDNLFEEIISSESQRVFNLMTYVANEYKNNAIKQYELHISSLLDRTVALDAESANGLTEEASRYLEIACKALKEQMIADYVAGVLDQDRMEMLIGGGLGAGIVGKAIFQTIMS